MTKKSTKSKCLLEIPKHVPKTTPLIKPNLVNDKLPSTPERKTFRIDPPSDLLSRLHSFLPQIAEANKRLEVDIAEDPRKLDIENVDENDEQYIEMDLGLGIFDMKPKDNKVEDMHISTRAEEEQEVDAIVLDPSSISARRRPKPQIEVIDSRASDVESDAAMDE
ncbi:hypothetical protein GGI20_004474 [Coemansia sp. BCRC 34301]|nr:hypothetical protein GGI20_004474 [Coemansia sp. BCRC 34301]